MTRADRLVRLWIRPAHDHIFDTGGNPAARSARSIQLWRPAPLRRRRPDAGRRLARSTAAAALLAIAILGTGPALASAQGVMDRAPNMTGTWTGASGTLYFNFLHRFTATDAPNRKVLNFPTFLLGAGLPANLLAGFRYATNSDLVPSYPNEWEFFGRWNPLAQTRGGPFDVGIHAGYNIAAESFDAELTVARAFGPLRIMAAGRGFSDTFATGESNFAVAGGATLALNRTFALAGDVAKIFGFEDAAGGEPDVAWGAGIQIAIPYTPHTLSIQATNTNTGTLQGSSIGGETRRYGFEFTIPFTLSRYFGGRAAAAPAPGNVTTTSGDTVRIVIRNLAYATTALQINAGTTVVWVNEDAVQHTVTADDGSFDSGLIDPRASWSRTFDSAGTIAYHCIPHPFMRATLTVR